MRRNRKFIFLPIALAATLLLGACAHTEPGGSGTGPSTVDPVDQKYTVSFDANGGSGTMADVADVKGEYTLPESTFTAPQGKHFVGWKVNNEGNNLQPGAKITVSANAKIYAQWELTTYTVSFDANGGAGAMTAVPNQVGEYTLPESTFNAPEGKYFAGWRVNGQGDLLQPAAKINVASDVRLVAQWELVKYTVSFVANGGSGEMANIPDQLGEYTLPQSAFTAPAGQHFVGWKIGGEGDTLEAGEKITVSANVQLVAQWEVTKYTVSFAANGGTGSMDNVPEQLGDYVLPDSSFTAPSGKHFVGWKVNDQGDLLQPGETIQVAADVQLVAQWVTTTYTVSFVANGATGTMADDTEKVGEYVLPQPTFTAPEGYHFSGWKVGGEGELLAAGASITVSGNVQLVAQWALTKYTVSFSANGGTGTMDNVPDQLGEYTLPESAFTPAQGYRFIGWKVNGEGDTLAAGAKIAVGSNVLLVAQWELIKYTVSFSANGGTGTMNNVPDQLGEYTLPESAFTAPEGKRFVGWKVNGEGDTLAAGAKITIAADVQLVAQWVLITYTVSFNVNGGSGEMASVPDQLGEYTLPDATFTAPAGKHFVGWKVNGEGDTLAAGSKINVSGNVQLVAQWETNIYTVTFKNGENVITTQQVAHGQKATYEGDAPTKAADGDACKYRFTGWDKDLATTLITENTVFEAQFASYAQEMVIDDFESYEESAEMLEAGWVALGYHNDTQIWDENTKAAVSLGSRSVEGEKSLRFDAWENGVGYKFKKAFTTGQFAQDANALKFRMMLPAINTVKVILYANAVVQGQVMEVQFQYAFQPTSGEFVEYTIPLADNNWKAWGEEGKTITALAGAAGLCEDDIVKYATKIEFYIQGSDASQGGNGYPYIAFLDSIRFATLEDPQRSEIETMRSFNKYTGYAADGSTIKFAVGENGAATATVLDGTYAGQSIPGTVAVEGKKLTFTSADEGASLVYVGNFVNGGQQIEGVSANGTLKSIVGPMDLNAVQTVDNYEQYASDGTAYYQGQKDMSKRSGCRGAYYSEYYSGSGSTEWGGSNWSLLGGDGSQLKLKSDGAGHNSSSKYLCLKNSSSSGMRYMQWGLFDGSSEQNSFRGSKFSFWARSNGRVPEFKVYMYSQTTPRNATKDSYVKSVVFRENAQIDSWKHYEIELNPNVVYYGFMIFMEKNLVADSYLYIDDVEVYSASPYAANPVELDHDLDLAVGSAYTASIAGQIRAEVDILGDNNVSLKAPGLGMNVPGTYAVVKDEVTLSLNGGVTYKAKLSEDLMKMSFKSVEGEGQVAQALNNLSFSKIDMLEDAESYDGDGKMYYQGNKDESQISGARGAYYCDYYTNNANDSSPVGGSKWNLMGGSGDQLQLDKTTGADGSQSLKMKGSTAGAMRYCQWSHYKGNTKYHVGYDQLVIHMKNPNAKSMLVHVYAFTKYKLTSSSVGSRVSKDITVPANSDWTAYSVPLDKNTAYYGYGVCIENPGAAQFLNVDRVYFCTNETNADVNFYAKKDVVLNGELNDGVAASFKFGSYGVIYATCAALSLDNAQCSYTMVVDGEGHQIMTVTIGSGDSKTVITGVYAVSALGVATFTISGATGAAAAYVKNGNVFTSAS